MGYSGFLLGFSGRYDVAAYVVDAAALPRRLPWPRMGTSADGLRHWVLKQKQKMQFPVT